MVSKKYISQTWKEAEFKTPFSRKFKFGTGSKCTFFSNLREKENLENVFKLLPQHFLFWLIKTKIRG